MIETIAENIYRLTIPMPKNPLKYLNAYLLHSSEGRHCLIDTGLNRPDCHEALMQGLKDLNVAIARTDVLLTHMHSDHSGLAPMLYAQGARIWMSSFDAPVLTQSGHWSDVLASARINGLPDEEVHRAMDAHPGYKYRPQGEVDIQLLKDEDIFRRAGFNLHCLITPGHTKGHLCFYEPKHRMLFAGDMLLQEITPNISQWLPGKNPLQDYMQSLNRLETLEVDLVLPGHRRLFTDHRKRIQELREHHAARLEEVSRIVQANPGHAMHIASHMHWDLDTPDWERFPLAQKWFATGEALAHLSFLQAQGRIRCKDNGRHHIWVGLEDQAKSSAALHQPR